MHVRPDLSALLLLGGALALTGVGCTTTPYRYGGCYHTENDVRFAPGEAQIERGRAIPALDTVGWVVGVPSKIVMLDHRFNNHDVSTDTEAALGGYLASNRLDHVKVRVNQYDPGGEWKRLAENKSVGWPARYTVGALSLIRYTVLPGRVFGGDHYNPYTNTINVYSDVPAIALYQGGHAKDYAQKEFKGTYAVASLVPGVNLWHNAKASGDAMSYIAENGTSDDLKDGYRSACPMYAMKTSEPIAAAVGGGVLLPAMVAGHAVGQVKAATVREPAPPRLPPPAVQQATFSAPLPLR